MSKKKFYPLLAALTLALLTGCSSVKISPAIVHQGVSAGVSYSVTKYPNAVPYLRAAAPVICSAANSTNLSPNEVVSAIESSGASAFKTPEGVLILNTALTIYIGLWNSYGDTALNNAPQFRLYLLATCNGLNDGLASRSGVASSPSATWPRVTFPAK